MNRHDIGRWWWKATPFLRRCWWTGHKWRGPVEVLPEQDWAVEKVTILYRPCQHCGGCYTAAVYSALSALPDDDKAKMLRDLDAAGRPFYARQALFG